MNAETKALIKARANDFLDIRKWDVITTCAHYGITPTQLYHAATIAQGKIKAGIYDKAAYRNLGILNSLSISYSLVQNIIGRDLPVRYTEVIKALQDTGRLEIKPRGTLLNRKQGRRVSFGIRYLPPLHDMETAYNDTQIKADIIAQRDFSPRAKKYIAKICAMRKRETPAGDTPAEKPQPEKPQPEKPQPKKQLEKPNKEKTMTTKAQPITPPEEEMPQQAIRPSKVPARLQEWVAKYYLGKDEARDIAALYMAQPPAYKPCRQDNGYFNLQNQTPAQREARYKIEARIWNENHGRQDLTEKQVLMLRTMYNDVKDHVAEK